MGPRARPADRPRRPVALPRGVRAEGRRNRQIGRDRRAVDQLRPSRAERKRRRWPWSCRGTATERLECCSARTDRCRAVKEHPLPTSRSLCRWMRWNTMITAGSCCRAEPRPERPSKSMPATSRSRPQRPTRPGNGRQRQPEWSVRAASSLRLDQLGKDARVVQRIVVPLAQAAAGELSAGANLYRAARQQSVADIPPRLRRRHPLSDHLLGQSRPDPRSRAHLSRPGIQAAKILRSARAPLVPFCPRSLARQLDKFRPLFGRSISPRNVKVAVPSSRRKRAPLFPGLVEQLHDFRVVCVGFGEFGPSVSNQRLDRLMHRLHPQTHGLSVLVKGRLLLRIEGELRLDLLEPLFRAHRERGSLNADPQSAADKA